jgi:DNA-binding transcriptional ArsR family regulator
MTSASDRPHVQAEIDQVSAMVHPVRRRIHDLLAVNGPATVGTLAEQTGERVGSVSHHLKMLGKAGLIEEAPELARDRRESWWRPVKASWSWSITDFAHDPAGEIVAQAAEQEQLRTSVDKARQWYATRDEYNPAWVDAAYTSTTWLKLSPAQLTELSQRMTALLQDFVDGLPDDADDPPRAAASDTDDRESVYVFTYAIPVKP